MIVSSVKKLPCAKPGRHPDPLGPVGFSRRWHVVGDDLAERRGVESDVEHEIHHAPADGTDELAYERAPLEVQPAHDARTGVALVRLRERETGEELRLGHGVEVASTIRLGEVAALVAESREAYDPDLGNWKRPDLEDLHAAVPRARSRPDRGMRGIVVNARVAPNASEERAKPARLARPELREASGGESSAGRGGQRLADVERLSPMSLSGTSRIAAPHARRRVPERPPRHAARPRRSPRRPRARHLRPDQSRTPGTNVNSHPRRPL